MAFLLLKAAVLVALLVRSLLVIVRSLRLVIIVMVIVMVSATSASATASPPSATLAIATAICPRVLELGDSRLRSYANILFQIFVVVGEGRMGGQRSRGHFSGEYIGMGELPNLFYSTGSILYTL